DSENMLQVLSQAIGGIVHDLGNPLTSVRTGAQTLDLFIEDGDTDKETLKEFTSIITDGAQMLDYLRLSLMEQTRVLEGKPLPLDCKNISLRHIIEAGARYQKPKFASGRKVSVIGEDLDICVDEMKMITVFMNLIGNALKYSDGEVRITWRMNKDILLVAIMDQGQQGRGISRDQAEQLFVAFGRLDTHASVEGTGLGLLSVKKIVEAHGGQVFIEGHIDGTLTSAAFCTAQGPCLSVLDEGFCTAFVLTLPLKLTS
ncbi:MAG: HAMP domain-containing histidine kinase, partial [Abitibacteriaceae bacterium]|nr:HAMP domain-containing histidine kinase [Abditibacteriaceae bacterium]